MEIVKRLVLILLLTLIGLLIIFIVTIPKPKNINLINDYKIVIKSDTNVKLLKDKEEIITDYIGEYSYGKRYILLKCLDNKEEINVIFYIIDTKDNDVHGPYKNYEIFESAKEVVVDEEISDFIKILK